MPADVSVSLPPLATDVVLESVASSSESWTSPIYYGYRIGYFLNPPRRFGIELEFIHAKVFLDHSQTTRARGIVGGEALAGPFAVSSLVQRLSLSHGLNFVLANAVVGRTIGASQSRPRARIEARAGGGMTVPHVEATIAGLSHEGYQIGGPAAQATGGVLYRVVGSWCVLGEYKVTGARQSFEVAEGRVLAGFITHHVVFGVAWSK